MSYKGFILLVPCLILINTCINYLLVRRPRDRAMNFPHSVAVLLPLRNETHNVRPLIASLQAQKGVRDLHIFLIDDNSSDDTFFLAQESIAGDARFELIRGKPLPDELFGKPHALQQGFERTNSEFVVVIDADVRLVPNAIASSLTLLNQLKLDFASSYPREIAISWTERVIQPLLQWSWITTVPLRIAEKSTNPALAVANGQFFFARRLALEKSGGFTSVRRKVLDDIELARTLLRNGFHGTVFEGSRIAQCRMYQSWSEVREGYGKSLLAAFGGKVGTCVAIAFLIVTGLLPLVFGAFGFWEGWFAFGAVLISRILAALATRGRILDGLLHPLSCLVLIYLIMRSWRMRGKTQWKGRVV